MVPTMHYAFHEYLLDPATRELRCGDDVLPVEPLVFDLILYLVQNRERVVSQDELLDAVWDGRLVSESTFRNRINAARRVLGDDGRQQKLIRTIARRGLRFVGGVVEEEVAPPSKPHLVINSEVGELHYPHSAEPADPQNDFSASRATSDGPGRKPVVTVLPFTNLSGDPDQEHIGDGITEDITTALARHRSLLVVARNSAFAFRGHADDARHIGRQLGADYIVEGSVRRTGPDVRVTAHLIETAGGRLLWAERCDRSMEELFEVQDAIIATIVASIEPQIGSAERSRVERKAPANLKAWDLFQLGTKHLYKATRDDNREAQWLLRAAIEHDSALAQAYAYGAYAILLSMLYFDADPEEERLAEALLMARKGMELDAQDAMIRFVYGRVLLARRDYGDALEELQVAVDLNPTLAIGHCGVGDSLAYEGRYDEAFPHFQRAIELSPHDPQRWAFYAYRAMAHLFARQFHLAYDWARKATRIPNCHYWAFSHRVAALGHLSRAEECERAVAELFERRPGFTCEVARRRLFYIKDHAQLELYLEGLRKAGIPE